MALHYAAVTSDLFSSSRSYGDQEDGEQKDSAGSEVPQQEPKRQRTFATVVREVTRGLSLKEFEAALEPLLRRVVREEVERALPLFLPSPSFSNNQFDVPQPRTWQLHFEDKFPSILFTGSRIQSANYKPVKVVLRDAISKKCITSGHLSSIKVQIVAIDGDFLGDDHDDWDEDKYSAHILRAREGKRPLLIGEDIISLENGVGYVSDVSFTDNSSWVRSRKFRLGARFVASVNNKASIREAISDAFVVKDQRGEFYKKHDPPCLVDEIWRLEKIAKDGAFDRRLSKKGIITVKDFLQQYHIDPLLLRSTLGDRISNRKWETIIEHANRCVLDDKLYLYYGDGVGIAFNSILKVVAATFDGQNYVSLDKLNILQMELVENLKRLAYSNLSGLVPLNELDSAMLQSLFLVKPSSSPTTQNANPPGLQ